MWIDSCSVDGCGVGGHGVDSCVVGGQGVDGRGVGGGGVGSLQVLAVVPVVLLVLASQEVGEVVSLALQQLDEVVGTVVTLLQCQLGIHHLLLCGHHHCGE